MTDAIAREIAGTDFMYDAADKELLLNLFAEINDCYGLNLHYLAEVDYVNIPDAANIIAKWIPQFQSETVKAYLLPQLFNGRLKERDSLIFQMYLHFKNSSEYISPPGVPAPAHIYVRYDNAFRRLRSKKLVCPLLSILFNPRDAFYLPLTINMLAAWKTPELEDILIKHLGADNLSATDLGLKCDGELYFPPLAFIIRNLRFSALNGLKNYPSQRVRDVIYPCTFDSDADIQQVARTTLSFINKSL